MPARFPEPVRAILASALVIATAGCAGSSDPYPSLAPRPIEQISMAEPNRPEAPAAVADPAAVQRYAPLIAQAQAADADFRRVLEEERPALVRGRGAGEGSDAWLAAQVSLSRIETARGPVAKALASLDAARSGLDPQTDTGAMVAIGQAFDAVQRISDREGASLAQAAGR
ncbi:hypothetical protein [Sphingomonas oryzagri]|uniref:Uncharacterized protein n=1 Tax=Sphingomonas oryzagri TaxID=3042314 RepID=A0ABT6MXL9_9SPHN|nr:hypothetical protein [Sphingomonas oryzagri]MDH7637799.1 hypothetical protein [Sphingomonas oryzagri]